MRDIHRKYRAGIPMEEWDTYCKRCGKCCGDCRSLNKEKRTCGLKNWSRRKCIRVHLSFLLFKRMPETCGYYDVLAHPKVIEYIMGSNQPPRSVCGVIIERLPRKRRWYRKDVAILKNHPIIPTVVAAYVFIRTELAIRSMKRRIRLGTV